tara:strand:- start:272 stop:427 length:156 start_codon:yes stop_codon:yes gene_type:complete
MKLEILKDNKNTQVRVGTIITVQQRKGKDWVKKGWHSMSQLATQGIQNLFS